MARTTPKRLREHLYKMIDTDDLIKVELIDRYVEMYEQMRKAERLIRKEDVVTITVNSSQKFIKKNPAVDVWLDMNKAMNSYAKNVLSEIIGKTNSANLERQTNTEELSKKVQNINAAREAIL